MNTYIKLIRMAFFVAVVVAMASACTDINNGNKKVRSIGNTSEVLIVVQNEQQWDNNIGKTIRQYLAKDQYGLNQPEPVFKLSHIQRQSFSELFQKQRNILIVNIDKKAKNPKIEIFKDQWAAPQVVIKITALTSDGFIDTFKNNAELFSNKFNTTERERILSVYRTSAPNKITKKVAEVFGLDMVIPKDYYVAKYDSNFMWIRRETHDFSQGLIIFSEPYVDTAQFSTASIIARTNRYQKQFVPGSAEGSYMSTDDKYVLPRATVISDFFTDYAIEIRGLWTVKGDFMGGPFLSYTFVDPRHHTIVTIMGYVYYPNKNKRDMLRQMEAIIYSTRFSK